LRGGGRDEKSSAKKKWKKTVRGGTEKSGRAIASRGERNAQLPEKREVRAERSAIRSLQGKKA